MCILVCTRHHVNPIIQTFFCAPQYVHNSICISACTLVHLCLHIHKLSIHLTLFSKFRDILLELLLRFTFNGLCPSGSPKVKYEKNGETVCDVISSPSRTIFQVFHSSVPQISKIQAPGPLKCSRPSYLICMCKYKFLPAIEPNFRLLENTQTVFDGSLRNTVSKQYFGACLVILDSASAKME